MLQSFAPSTASSFQTCGVIVRQVAVANKGELEALTRQGLARRTVASTCTNAASSRSHCLITLIVQRRLPDGGLMHGKLTLVDLAGRVPFLPCCVCRLTIPSAVPDTCRQYCRGIAWPRWKLSQAKHVAGFHCNLVDCTHV